MLTFCYVSANEKTVKVLKKTPREEVHFLQKALWAYSVIENDVSFCSQLTGFNI